MDSTTRPRSQRPTALVTGAASGIGRSFAHELAKRGYDLVLVDRDEVRLRAEATTLKEQRPSAQVETLAADLCDREQLAQVEARLAESSRPVDLLVNNAGFGLKGRFLDNDVEAEQAMLDVLVVAVMRLSHAALGAMVKRGHGGLINVSSVASFLPRGTYAAAKTWVNSFGQWAANEYGPRGVTVTTLCPGFVKTEFHERMDVSRDSAPADMWMEPDELVRRAIADHADGKVFSVPGTAYKVLRVLSRILPANKLQGLQTVGREG